MALVVETGTADPLATSYVSRETFVAYCVSVGDEAHTNLDEAGLDAALVRAARFLEKYKARWIGTRSTRDQGLAWPRVGVTDADGYAYDSDEIPQAVKVGQMYAAILDINSALSAVNSATPIIRLREKVDGVVETETEYAAPTLVQTAKPVAEIDNLLVGLLRSSYSSEIIRG